MAEWWELLQLDPFGTLAPSGLMRAPPGYMPGQVPALRTDGTIVPGGEPGKIGPPPPPRPGTFNWWADTALGFTPFGAAQGLAEVVDAAERGAPWGTLVPLGALAALGAVPGAGAAARTTKQVNKLASEMGMSTTPFYRGGVVPASREYGGAHFSRDREYAEKFSRQGAGLGPERGATNKELREFRLDLSKTFADQAPVDAATYARLVVAAEPKLAAELVDMIAPGKNPAWFKEFARRNPDMMVSDNGALVRQAIEVSSRNPIALFKRAGFDALDSGRDVRKLTGDGIRLKEAAFDPARRSSRDIMASLMLGLPVAGALAWGPPEWQED